MPRGSSREPADPYPSPMSSTGEKLAIGGIIALLLYALSLLRFPLTWYVLGVLNLLAGAIGQGFACLGIGALLHLIALGRRAWSLDLVQTRLPREPCS